MPETVHDTPEGDRRWEEMDRALRERQLEYLRGRFPGEEIPNDNGLLGAFNTSRGDHMYDRCVADMSDKALAFALTHETVKAGLVKLRREARRRGLPKRGERRA